jgi:hypothetical protein
MTLRRFPWKVPRLSDNSYKLFAAEPTPGHDPKKLSLGGSKSGSVAAKAKEEPSADAAEKAKAEKLQQEAKEVSDMKDATEERAKATETGIKPEAAAEKTDNDGHTEQGENNKETGDRPTEAAKTEDKPAEKREVIRGPWRILRLLPRESRHVIGGMLAIDPKDRIKMADLIKDPWVANTVICRQVEPSRIIRSSTHTHILEQPTPAMK